MSGRALGRDNRCGDAARGSSAQRVRGNRNVWEVGTQSGRITRIGSERQIPSSTANLLTDTLSD